MQGATFIIKADGSIVAAEHSKALSLDYFQKAVGGYIEQVPLFNKVAIPDLHSAQVDCIVFCNEEGKLEGLPVNELATKLWYYSARRKLDDVLNGDVIIVTGDKEFLSRL